MFFVRDSSHPGGRCSLLSAPTPTDLATHLPLADRVEEVLGEGCSEERVQYVSVLKRISLGWTEVTTSVEDDISNACRGLSIISSQIQSSYEL